MWSSTCWALHLAIVTVLSIIVVGNIIVIIVLIMIISIALIINALLLFRLDHCSEEGEHILPLKFAQDRLFIVVLIFNRIKEDIPTFSHLLILLMDPFMPNRNALERLVNH